MKEFIQAGILHCSDFPDQDIEDRAKANPFAKGFAILQHTWIICNVIARWASDLPVSPIELLTVAYVVYGLLVYAVWWYKPKNMSTWIKIYIRYTRATLPAEIHRLTESHPKGWVHLRVRIKNEAWISLIWKIIKAPVLVIYDSVSSMAADEATQRYLNNHLSIYCSFSCVLLSPAFSVLSTLPWKFPSAFPLCYSFLSINTKKEKEEDRPISFSLTRTGGNLISRPMPNA